MHWLFTLKQRRFVLAPNYELCIIYYLKLTSDFPSFSFSPTETREFTAAAIAGIRVSAEGQAGLNAFLNKDKAPWVLKK